MKQRVYPLYGQELQQLRQIIEADRYLIDQKPGMVSAIDVFSDYQAFIMDRFKITRKLKLVIDCGNGSAGIFAPHLFRNLGCDVVELYTEPNATFPNHVPDPEMPQNMKDLQAELKRTQADLGLAFDADGDRVGFVDETGQFIDADDILLLLAKDLLATNPGREILFDVKCTQLLEELVPQFGGIPLMHKTGHAPIKQTLREDDHIILGGEISGHFYHCQDYFKIDDGLYTAVVVLKLLSDSSKTLSQLLSFIPQRIRTPEIKLPCADEGKFDMVTQITKQLQQKYRTITIDGSRFYLDPQTWGLIRASNTSPYLTLRIESTTQDKLLQVKNLLADYLETYPQVTDRLDRTHVTSLTGKLGWV